MPVIRASGGPARAPSARVAVACMLLVAAMVLVLAVAHVSRRQDVIRLGYELNEASTTLRQVQEEGRRLRLEKSVLTNHERIEELARTLGMRQPAAGQIVSVRPEITGIASLGDRP